MKSKIESNIYFLFILFYFIVNLTNIKCKENKTEYKYPKWKIISSAKIIQNWWRIKLNIKEDVCT